MVYVRGSRKEPSIDHFVKKVWFFLHPSYKPNDLVEVRLVPISARFIFFILFIFFVQAVASGSTGRNKLVPIKVCCRVTRLCVYREYCTVFRSNLKSLFWVISLSPPPPSIFLISPANLKELRKRDATVRCSMEDALRWKKINTSVESWRSIVIWYLMMDVSSPFSRVQLQLRAVPPPAFSCLTLQTKKKSPRGLRGRVLSRWSVWLKSGHTFWCTCCAVTEE